MERAATVPQLVQQLRSGSSAPQKQQALAQLEQLSAHAASSEAVVAAGGVPLILQCLQPGASAPETLVTAASTLSNLTAHSRGAAAVMAAGSMAEFVRLLGHTHAAAQMSAAGALYNLVDGSEDNAAAAADAGAVPALARLARQPAPALRDVAALALSSLAVEGSPQTAAAVGAADGAVAGMVRLLHSSAAFQASRAASALWRLSEGNVRLQRAIVADPQGIPGLVRHLGLGDDAQGAQRSAVGCLHNICAGGSTATCAAVAAAGLEPLARLYGACADEEVRQVAGSALTHLADRGDPEVSQQAKRMFLQGTVLQHASRMAAEMTATAGARAAPAGPPPVEAMVAEASNPAPANPADGWRPRVPRVCASPGCGATTGLRRCAACRRVRYCSQACQQADWRAHKADCRRMAAERAARAAARAEAAAQE